VQIWGRITEHGSAKKCGREKSQKSQSPYIYLLQSLSNHPGSRTILFAIAVSGADAICNVADTACACVSDAVLNY